MMTENIGTVSAVCGDDVKDEDCLRTLKDETCKLGGDVVWGVADKPEMKGGKKRLSGRAAHAQDPTATGKPAPPQHAGALTNLIMRLLADDPEERPTAEEARDTLAAVAEGRSAVDGAGATGTAVLDAGAAGLAAQGGRTVVYQDTRATAGAPEQGGPAPTAPIDRPVAATARPASAPDGAERSSGDNRRPLLLALAAVAVVAVVILAVVLVRGGNAPTPPPAAAAPSSAAAPAPVVTRTGEPTASAAPSTSATPTTPTTTTSPTDTGTPAVTDPVGFVQSYYGLLPGNTDAAWSRLGPDAQRASGGREGFNSFYAGLSRVWAENLRVSGDTVTATIVFTQRDGQVSREGYQFVIANRDGRQVIASFGTT